MPRDLLSWAIWSGHYKGTMYGTTAPNSLHDSPFYDGSAGAKPKNVFTTVLFKSEHLYPALGSGRLPTELGVLVSRICFLHEKQVFPNMKIDQEPPCAVATVRSNIFYKHNRPWAVLPGECERALQALRRNLGA